jgi:hypothetical protein
MLRGSKGHTILVLGAGVVGLSTAINSYITWPDADVTVMADTFYSGTTSNGAGGIFRPTFDKLPGVPESMLRYVVCSCTTNNSSMSGIMLTRSLTKENKTIGNYFLGLCYVQ